MLPREDPRTAPGGPAKVLPFRVPLSKRRNVDTATGASTRVMQNGGATRTVAVGPRRRRWTINGDFIGLQPTGVARYASEVAAALDRLVGDRHSLTEGLDLDVVCPRPPGERVQFSSIAVHVVPEFDRPRLPQFWVQVQLPWHVEGGLLSFCNLAPVAIRRQIVCIHDLHTRLMPESYGRLFRWAHRLILPALGRRAAHVTTVSELSRSHLVEFGIADPGRITVTYNGSDHALRWDATRSHLARTPARGYVLCLGRPQRYKNVELMLRLAPMLDTLGLELWMAGDIDPARIAEGEGGVPRNLRLLGRISDEDFKAALLGALCFVFPSRIEGFGLPAVEAMAVGCPVIASTAPCLPEVCGEAALYGDPDDPAAWFGQVRRLFNDAELRNRMVEAGHARARDFSWKRIAETYLALMARIDGVA